MSAHDLEATRYLLGEMDEAERDAFEARLLADDEAHELVRAAEDDLFDAYAAGELPAARRAAFEERFLAGAEGKARLASARLLARRAIAPAKAAGRRRSWFLGLGFVGAAVAAVVAVLLLAGGKAGPPAPKGSVEIAVLLVPATRGAIVPAVNLPAGTEKLRLEPDLDGEIRSARMRGPGAAADVPVRADGDAFLVDAAALAPGRYELVVTLDGGEVVTLPFDLAR